MDTTTASTTRTQLFTADEGNVLAPLSTHYRNTAWNGDPTFLTRLSQDDYAASIAKGIYNEAAIANDEHDAHKLNESTVVGVDTAAIVARDNEAALRQAELLGATADQRRKLRTIVEERAAAQREVEALKAEVERLKNEPITGDDRRVWPLFGRAADEADTQGYCSVYEQISNAVGIPTRDELKEEGYATMAVDYEATYDVTFTFSVRVGLGEYRSSDEAMRDAPQSLSSYSARDEVAELLGIRSDDLYNVATFVSSSLDGVSEVDN